MRSDSNPASRSRRVFLARSAGVLLVPSLAVSLPAVADELRVGSPAPPATLVTLDGQTFSTAALKGRVILLTFWATWCSPCHAELPLLSRYAAENAAAGLIILGFSLDTADAMAEVRATAHALSFPVGLLGASSAPGYGRIWRCPVSFLIDRDGRLVQNGWKSPKGAWNQDQLDQLVTPLLRG